MAERQKLVRLVPHSDLDGTREAVVLAGARWVGDDACPSWLTVETGTFNGSGGTMVAHEEAGRDVRVAQAWIETTVPAERLAGVAGALCRAHPDERPSCDVYQRLDA